MMLEFDHFTLERRGMSFAGGACSLFGGETFGLRHCRRFLSLRTLFCRIPATCSTAAPGLGQIAGAGFRICPILGSARSLGFGFDARERLPDGAKFGVGIGDRLLRSRPSVRCTFPLPGTGAILVGVLARMRLKA